MAVFQFVAAALVSLLLLIHVTSFVIAPSQSFCRRNVCLSQQESNGDGTDNTCTRRRLLTSIFTTATSTLLLPSTSHAAPPIAIIAEELGYFPVTNSEGKTVYIPKKVSRESSEQAIQLAKYLRDVS